MDFAANKKLVIIDADDTLWENEPLFRGAEARWAGILAAYGDKEELYARLYDIEIRNMADLGYGVKSFIINMLEAAIDVTGGRLTSGQTEEIIRAGREILQNPATPMPGVKETLERLRGRISCPMVLYTKGELLDQRRKASRSGLVPYFDFVTVVSRKDEDSYKELCARHGIKPCELLSIGNSLKSDIAPVLRLGGWGIHVPYRITWEHEKSGPIESPRLRTVGAFSDILQLV